MMTGPVPANRKAPPAPMKEAGHMTKMQGPTNKGQKWGPIFRNVNAACPSPPAIKSMAYEMNDSDNDGNKGHTF